jgi:hypothetical protein
MPRTRRWPKGTYMQLINPDRLRSFVGPEPSKKMSGRRLARYIEVHPSFVDHLISGRRRSCKNNTAERIAEALDVPLEILFVPVTPSATGQATKQSAA